MAFAASSQVQVKSGDSLYGIAKQNDTSVKAIMQANHLHSDIIRVGQVLQIPHPNTTSTTSKTASGSVHKATVKKKVAKPVSHKTTRVSHSSGPIRHVRVTQGDTLWGISSLYGVSVKHLETWNHISPSSVLHLGEQLVIYGGKQPPKATSRTSSSSHLSGRSGGLTGALGSGVFGEQVVGYAKQFLGVHYAWGGESPRGFDCSGLVQFTYAHFGVSLPRDSYSQYNVGSYVSERNLLPGDLVFFDTDGAGASHVGMYVGGGTFINSAGRGVQINSLYNSYWASHYLGARRVH